jgi:hypothetical protein
MNLKIFMKYFLKLCHTKKYFLDPSSHFLYGFFLTFLNDKLIFIKDKGKFIIKTLKLLMYNELQFVDHLNRSLPKREVIFKHF